MLGMPELKVAAGLGHLVLSMLLEHFNDCPAIRYAYSYTLKLFCQQKRNADNLSLVRTACRRRLAQGVGNPFPVPLLYLEI